MIEPLHEIEQRAILAALQETGGDVNAASRGLEIAPATLYRRVAALGMDLEMIRAVALVARCSCGDTVGDPELRRVVARCRVCAKRTGLPYYTVK